jgi:hypothetical protein
MLDPLYGYCDGPATAEFRLHGQPSAASGDLMVDNLTLNTLTLVTAALISPQLSVCVCRSS